MKILISVAALLLISAKLYAQSTISVDINRAYFNWTWSQGTGGPASQFNIKCGSSSGQYTINAKVADPSLREYPVKSVVPSSGNYYCVISASNQFGESSNSAEVPFAAGAIPLSPTAFGLIAK